MLSPLSFRALLRGVVGASIAASVSACGSDVVHNKDFGEPPDAGFSPGQGAGGDGYGSGYGNNGNGGTDGGAFDAGPPTCSDNLKRCSETFTFPFSGEVSVELRGDYRAGAWTSGDAMQHVGNAWTVTVSVPFNTPVLYKLFVNGTTWTIDSTKPTQTDATNNTNNVAAADACTDFTCSVPGPTPPGVYDWRDAVIYFAFVDRFFDGNAANNCSVAGTDAAGNFKGGDWLGVTAKLAYLKALGINTIWLTVPLKNADTFAGHGTGGDTHMYSAYHGYWPSDPTQTESCFGTPAELKALVDAAHAPGTDMKVIFDYAMVHVQSASTIFQQHADWFWPNASNGHDCICGQGCDWNNDAQRCWFTDYLPHWNYTVAAARDFSVNAAVDLAKKNGADGFRLDAIKHVDGSWLTQLRSTVASQIQATQVPKQRFYMVGETYDFSNQPFIKSFVDPATKLDGQFDFPMRLHLVKALLLGQEGMDALAGFMQSNEDYYGTEAVMSTFLGNHDLPRTIHLAQQPPVWTDPYTDGKDVAWANQPQLPSDANAFTRMAMAFGVLFTHKGAPLIYYGDEIGLPGAGDPDNRRPMQWTTLSAGQQTLYTAVQKLIAVRAAHPALRRGALKTIVANATTWAYSRDDGAGDVVYVVASPTGNMNAPGVPTGLTSLYSAPGIAIYAK